MKDNNKKDVDSISKMLQKGLDELFSCDRYEAFLKMISRFPNYSYRNILLLLRQCPHATSVKGFRSWIKLGRMVKTGERALRIIAPFVKEEHRDKEKGEDKTADTFRRISVFDISQTEGIEGFPDSAGNMAPIQIAGYPFHVTELNGNVENFHAILAAMREISPYHINIEPVSGIRKGYCNYSRRVIGIKQGLSQLHTLKTCVHEIAHALLHGDVNSKQRKEIEAESVAFIVCRYFDMDTSDYSFNYIAGYSIGKEKKELKKFLDSIQKTASFLIDSIEGAIKAREIGYDSDEFSLLVNEKTILRLFGQGEAVYLVYPGKGELFVMDKKQLDGYGGPFAVERNVWRQTLDSGRLDAANAA